MGTGQPGGEATFSLRTDTDLEGFTHLLVFTANSAGESVAVAAVAFDDLEPPKQSVTELKFTDVDVAHDKLGGVVSWKAPEESTGSKWETTVTQHRVYLTTSAAGADRSALGKVPFYWGSVAVPPGTHLTALTHMVVWTYNAAGEQARPAAVRFRDFETPEVSVSGLKFVNTDKDAGEVGGRASWQPPSDLSNVDGYNAYLASDDRGSDKLCVGCGVLKSSLSHVVASNRELHDRTWLVVFTYNNAGDQDVPVALKITPVVDTQPPLSSVSALSSTDTDSDAGELGGAITWVSPDLHKEPDVTGVGVYIAEDAKGAGRTWAPPHRARTRWSCGRTPPWCTAQRSFTTSCWSAPPTVRARSRPRSLRAAH